MRVPSRTAGHSPRNFESQSTTSNQIVLGAANFWSPRVCDIWFCFWNHHPGCWGFSLPSKHTTEVPSRIFSPGSSHFLVANSTSPSLALFPPSLYTTYTSKFPLCPKLPVVTLLSWPNLLGSGQRSLNQRCLLKDKRKKCCSATNSTVRGQTLKIRKYKVFCSINYSIWHNFHALYTRPFKCFGSGRSWQQKKKSWHETCTSKSWFGPRLTKSPF